MECPSCHSQVDPAQRFCPACGSPVGSTGSSESSPDEGSVVGQVLGGKYKVVRLLGEGGMGAVYEGEQQLGTTKRKVAVKTLHPHLSRDPKIKARFEREVGTVAELQHPNTIQVYDFGANAEGILYIAMEFLQGRSLADLLEKEGALAPDRVTRIMQQVCGSLEEAHGRGIVHRDLKPDNVVLVERAGQKDFVKVLDFGIAKRSNEADTAEQKLTQQGMVLGTPPYMSPEQFSGRPIDARSDIYSLGVMAYEMLTGRLPFQANTAWEWATQHMTQPPAPIESSPEGARTPEPMRAAIRRALAKSPDERFQTVGDFGAAFSGTNAQAGVGQAPAAGRQKTEMGAPLDVAAAFGGQGGFAPAGVSHGQTPPGNMSFPTPAAIPQPPPRDSGGGKGRGTILAVAGVIAAASVAAIVFAMKGSGSGGGKSVEFDPTVAPAPQTSLSAGSVPTEESPSAPPASAGAGPEVPPLTGGGGHAVAPTHPNQNPPHPANGQPATPPSAAPPAPTKPAAPKYDGPECANARRLRALGHPKEAESWALACTAKGGTP